MDCVTTCVVVWIEIFHANACGQNSYVTTCVVVWIEIAEHYCYPDGIYVTTCVVVWIEITRRPRTLSGCLESPPAWWCGLKCPGKPKYVPGGRSPPAWWCGLKFAEQPVDRMDYYVTTCVVVWIEIITQSNLPWFIFCHHLRGGVD